MELTGPSGSDPVNDELEQLYELLYLLPVGVVAFDSKGSVTRATPVSVQLLNPFVAPAAMSNAFTLLAPLVPELATMIGADHSGPGGHGGV